MLFPYPFLYSYCCPSSTHVQASVIVRLYGIQVLILLGDTISLIRRCGSCFVDVISNAWHVCFLIFKWNVACLMKIFLAVSFSFQITISRIPHKGEDRNNIKVRRDASHQVKMSFTHDKALINSQKLRQYPKGLQRSVSGPLRSYYGHQQSVFMGFLSV